MVKQAVQLATETIGERVQKHSLLLRYEQDRLEQYSRRETIRITGIESNGEETNEQLTEKVIKVVKECDPTVSEADISVCHHSGPFNMRGGGRDGKRPVLCRFVARVRKTNVMRGKKQLKAKQEEFNGVYVNEDLTPLRAKLFRIASTHPTVKNATTNNGKIICWLKEPTGPHPIEIDSPDDLFKLGVDSVDYNELGLREYVYNRPRA